MRPRGFAFYGFQPIFSQFEVLSSQIKMRQANIRFSAPDRLKLMNLEYVFARTWKHPDNQIEGWRHASAKCAEALIPERIPPKFIMGAYVVSAAAQAELRSLGFTLPINIDPDLFFH